MYWYAPLVVGPPIAFLLIALAYLIARGFEAMDKRRGLWPGSAKRSSPNLGMRGTVAMTEPDTHIYLGPLPDCWTCSWIAIHGDDDLGPHAADCTADPGRYGRMVE